MSDSPILPRPETWTGTREWYAFFRSLAQRQQQGSPDVSAIERRVERLENKSPDTMLAAGSVEINGSVIQLSGDVSQPLGSQFYGTDAHGNRGWYTATDSIEAGYGIIKSPADGYTYKGELKDEGDLPGTASEGDAYLIDGAYWVWESGGWVYKGIPSNVARLSLPAGTNKDDGLLWKPGADPDYEVAPVVRNPMAATGDLIYRNSAGAPARLAAGSNGDHLVVSGGIPAWQTPTYGNLVAGSNVTLSGTLTGRLVGSGNVTISATGGGGGFPFVPPPQTGWSWVNQGSATITSTPDYQLISGGSSPSLNCRMRTRAAPAAPYAVTMGIEVTARSNSDSAVAAFWRDSSSGRLTFYGFLNGSIQSANYNNPSSYNSLVFNHSVFLGPILWLRLEDDGVNRSISYSSNGYDFIVLHTSARTDFITPDEIGFMTLVNNSMTPAHARLVHWQI